MDIPRFTKTRVLDQNERVVARYGHDPGFGALIGGAKRKREDTAVTTDVSQVEGEFLRALQDPSTLVSTRARQRARASNKRLKQALTKARRAAKRRRLHTARLRASFGEQTILEKIGIGDAITLDYHRHLLCFWEFVDRHHLSLDNQRARDCALCDWADYEYLDGETSSRGDKLLAAFEKWMVENTTEGVLLVPRFKRVLKYWRKRSPRQSRLPMPEVFMWALTGYLMAVHGFQLGLYHLTMFCTYLRPTAAIQLYATDVVAPDPTLADSQYVIIVSPFEKETATKSGFYDETVVLDGDVAPCLGRLLFTHAAERIASEKAKCQGKFVAEDVQLFDLAPRAFLEPWRDGVDHLALPDMDTPYQCRHGGASRDLLLRKRAPAEVTLRGFWADVSSMRTSHKPGRIQKLVSEADPRVVAYGLDVKENFESYVRSGRFPDPPKGKGGKKS